MKRETAERNYVITTTNIVIKLHLRKTEKDHISEITGVELEEIDKIIADFENGDIDEP